MKFSNSTRVSAGPDAASSATLRTLTANYLDAGARRLVLARSGRGGPGG
ncbi:hypothetical protein ACFY97_27975 [Streptomyces klenkii]